MGEDNAMLGIVTSANVPRGGHAGDPETMHKTPSLALANNVVVGAHPSYADRFGHRIIPSSPSGTERLMAAQIGALTGIATLAGTTVR